MAGAVDGTLSPHEKVDHKLTENPKFWREAKFIDNWDDRFQVIHYCAGLPTFDLSNTELQDYVICFLNDLISCGADGFRFDSAKSIPTPSEGCNFFPRVLSNLNSNHLFNYGEVIFADESLISMYTDYLDVLTNTWSECKDNVVLFSESHDSFLGLGYTRDKSSREVTLDYAHVVDNFPKTIYYARPFDDEWKSSAIKEIHQKSLVKK